MSGKVAVAVRGVVALALVTGLGAGCASANATMSGAILRPAVDAPAQFVAQGMAPAAPAEATTSPSCRNPLFDPRDSTRIVLDRSARGTGDYFVPANRYGVSDGELLRIDCSTGRPLGIVRR